MTPERPKVMTLREAAERVLALNVEATNTPWGNARALADLRSALAADEEERGRLLKLLRTIKPWVDHEDGPPSGTTFDEIGYVRSELSALLAKLEGKPQ